VLVDDIPVKSCTMLALSCEGVQVTTIEGLASKDKLHPMQEAFREHHGLQCGFCTPAMLITAQDLLKSEDAPDRERIREHLSGNYCRCTGYHAIVDAVENTARTRAGRQS